MRELGGFMGGSALCLLACCGTSYEGTPTVVYKPIPGATVMTTQPAPAPVACDLARYAWVQRSAGVCAGSTWRFIRMSDGTWRGSETGCAGATGRAAYNGVVLSVSFTAAGGAGVYTWPIDGACRTRPGTLRWTAGPSAGRVVESSLAPAR